VDELANLDFAAFEGEINAIEMLAYLRKLGPVLISSNICEGPAKVLRQIAKEGTYIDWLMGIVVAKRSVIEGLQTSLAGIGHKIAIAGNFTMHPLSSPEGGEEDCCGKRLWYVDRLGGWPELRGNDQTVAVVDTGIMGSHPCLTVAAGDFASLRGVGVEVSDYSDHGTNCAGVIASRCDQRIGVAPSCRLVVGQTLRMTHAGHMLSVEWALLTSWALHCCGARVFSFSWGAREPQFKSYVNVAVFSIVAARLRRSNSALLFCTAGKAGSTIYPAAAPGVIAVSGYKQIDERQVVLDLACAGFNDELANQPEMLLGPSQCVSTTKPGGAFNHFGGASAACAFVAGVAVLYLEFYPCMNLNQIVARMFFDAEEIKGEHEKIYKIAVFPKLRLDADQQKCS